MRIEGEWFRCDDGVVRPVVEVHVHDRDDRLQRDRFLVDTGSDRTVISAVFLRRLRVSDALQPSDVALSGIGGSTASVVVRTTFELTGINGRPAIVRGDFAAFTDPRASDLSILGRDVLDNFDVILSRRRDEVLLLAPKHQYRVTPA